MEAMQASEVFEAARDRTKRMFAGYKEACSGGVQGSVPICDSTVTPDCCLLVARLSKIGIEYLCTSDALRNFSEGGEVN